MCAAFRFVATPTFAAKALHFLVVFDNSVLTVAGTPARFRHVFPYSLLPLICVVHSQAHSWPKNVQIVVGIVTLINGFCISKNKPLFGFLAHWLHGVFKGLDDMTYGSYQGCNIDGFSAIPR